MPKIILKDVCLDYPIYNVNTTSIRHKILNTATGGRIAKSANEKTIVRALSHINLEVLSGDRLGILGHNGAGKSTLLRCISGIYAPTAGNLLVEGTVSSFMEIGNGLESELSGYNNIRRLLMLRSRTLRSNIANLTSKIADFSDLGDFLKFPVRTYSTGMTMRLLFSIATAETSDIIIMDEFLSVGDNNFTKKAEEKLHKNIKDASILVLASHDSGLLKNMCNRFVKLSHGKLEEVSL